MQKDTAFYDAESRQYSRKRYPEQAATYVQSFYLRRLAIVTGFTRALAKRKALSLLEIGCADGIVLRRLLEALPGGFSSLMGVDASPQMVEAARELSTGLPIEYAVRGEALAPRDLVLEVGVLNYVPNLEQELDALRAAIAPRGHAIISIAGMGSLWQRLKREGGGFAHFRSYAEYEAAIRARFSIVARRPAGLFIPHIWKAPALARVIQPAVEALVAPVPPGLFHEQLYLLAPL
jgi:SAM-dependent methyltransferase